MSLNTYDFTGKPLSLKNLNSEIKNSGHITGFKTLTKGTDPVTGAVTVTLWGDSNDNESAVQAIVDAHTGVPLEDLIFKSYHDHEASGRSYIKEITTVIVMDVYAGNVAVDDIYVIEDELEDVIEKLSVGHWKSAKKKFDKITRVDPFPEALYDRIKDSIYDYVANAYS